MIPQENEKITEDLTFLLKNDDEELDKEARKALRKGEYRKRRKKLLALIPITLGVIIFLLLVTSMLSICMEVSAAEETTNQKYEAYGLCVISKLIEYDENFDMNKYVDYDSYARIISFWFGVDTVAPPIPTNADAIYDMARFVTEDVKSDRSITEFKDFGFIEKDYRDAYKIMCSAGLAYRNTGNEKYS